MTLLLFAAIGCTSGGFCINTNIMKITHKTKTADILPLLDDNNVKGFLSQIPAHPLEKSIMSMSILEFSEILADEEAFIKKILDHKRALVAFGRLRSYKEQIEDISKFMKLYDYKKSAEEEQAAKGIVFPDFSMRMLADCVKFFNLHSFDEAEKVKVSEWLAIFQFSASEALFQYRFSKIIEDKTKSNKKR